MNKISGDTDFEQQDKTNEQRYQRYYRNAKK